MNWVESKVDNGMTGFQCGKSLTAEQDEGGRSLSVVGCVAVAETVLASLAGQPELRHDADAWSRDLHWASCGSDHALLEGNYPATSTLPESDT